jgi:hypothetical protein
MFFFSTETKTMTIDVREHNIVGQGPISSSASGQKEASQIAENSRMHDTPFRNAQLLGAGF